MATMRLITMRLLRAVLVSTLGGSFQFGFSTGFVNNTETFIRHYFLVTGVEAFRTEKHFNIMWSMAVSAFAVGGLVGTLIFPALANRVGRKWSIIATSGFCYASCRLIAFPDGWWALILGRVLVGVGAGGACAAVPLYVSEISPVEARGTLSTVHQLMITIGILTAQCLSASKLHLLGDDRLWHYIMLVPAAFTTMLVIALPTCEDSPVYLMKEVGEKRAMEALRWFRGSIPEKALWEELEAIQMELSMSTSPAHATGSGSGEAGFWEITRDRRLWGPVLVGVGVNLSMQLSGIDAVLYYSTRVLRSAGVALEWAQVYTALIALLNVLVTIPAMLLMDKAGRKVIQSLGLSGMCACYVVMTAALVTGRHLLAVGAMVCSVCCFAFGPGCIAWFIVAELTPVHVRGFATTMGLGANWLANFSVAFAFPHLLVRFHAWTFSIFATSTFLLAVFTVKCLPETKGKTAAEISHFFAAPQAARMPISCSLATPTTRLRAHFPMDRGAMKVPTDYRGRGKYSHSASWQHVW